MAQNNEYTHGGSAGKNLGLLMRALSNLISFGLLWAGLWGLETTRFGLPAAIAGGALTAVCLLCNLLGPAAGGKK